MKSSNLDSNLGVDEGKKIIDMEPNDTIATTKIQPKELEEFEEGEQLPFIAMG